MASVRLTLGVLAAVCLAVCCSSLLLVSASNVVNEIRTVRTPSANPRTLVILDRDELQQTHSEFFAQLTTRGHVLTFVEAGADPTLKLARYGSFFYDNLILMAPTSEDLGEAITVDSVQAFIDDGRSVLIVGNEKVSEAVRELATELASVDFDEPNTKVQDHVQFASGSELHDLVIGTIQAGSSRIVGGISKAPVVFRGIGHIAQPSNLLTGVLTGSPTAFSYALDKPVTEYPAATGSDVLLVSAMQTAGNARVVFSGSLDLFSNDLFQAKVSGGSVKSATKSGNSEFAKSLSMWAFHERGVLRARDLQHHKIGAEDDMTPTSYRVSDEIAFQIVLEEYDGEAHAWKPFQGADVQLEFTMIDPYIRTLLKSNGKGVYSTNFTVPDVYGVYKFVLNYHRLGYSYLDLAHTISVHPFRHDEYERFIDVAYPYYAGAFTMMAAFFVFGVVFLYHKE
jgi:oligosaccharyltransferase complex subunit beta